MEVSLKDESDVSLNSILEKTIALTNEIQVSPVPPPVDVLGSISTDLASVPENKILPSSEEQVEKKIESAVEDLANSANPNITVQEKIINAVSTAVDAVVDGVKGLVGSATENKNDQVVLEKVKEVQSKCEEALKEGAAAAVDVADKSNLSSVIDGVSHGIPTSGVENDVKDKMKDIATDDVRKENSSESNVSKEVISVVVEEKTAPQEGSADKPAEETATTDEEIVKKEGESKTEEVVAAVEDAVKKVATPVIESVQATVTPVVESIEKAASPVVESIEKAASPVVEALEKAVSPVIEAVEKAACPILEAVKEAGSPVVEKVEESKKAVTEETPKIDEVPPPLPASPPPPPAEEKIEEPTLPSPPPVLEQISEAVADVKGEVEAVAETVAKSLQEEKSAIEELTNKAAEVASPVVEEVVATATKTVEEVTDKQEEEQGAGESLADVPRDLVEEVAALSVSEDQSEVSATTYSDSAADAADGGGD